MAVASLAAILKAQILRPMQGNEEKRRGGGGRIKKINKRGSKTAWPSGHGETMCSCEGTDFEYGKYNIIENEKAEKSLFYCYLFSLLL